MSNWVHVSFYGRLPEGMKVEAVDVPTVSAELARTFGFTHVDGLIAVVAQPKIKLKCEGCGAEWTDSSDCACTCRPGDDNYEAWVIR